MSDNRHVQNVFTEQENSPKVVSNLLPHGKRVHSITKTFLCCLLQQKSNNSSSGPKKALSGFLALLETPSEDIRSQGSSQFPHSWRPLGNKTGLATQLPAAWPCAMIIPNENSFKENLFSYFHLPFLKECLSIRHHK